MTDDKFVSELVDALSGGGAGLQRPACACADRQPLPSRDTVIDIVEGLRSALFPGYFGPSDLTPESTAFHLGSALDRVSRDLRVLNDNSHPPHGAILNRDARAIIERVFPS